MRRIVGFLVIALVLGAGFVGHAHAATPAQPTAKLASRGGSAGLAVAPASGVRTQAAVPSDPVLGLGGAERTCSRDRQGHVATAPDQCTNWVVSGPMNIVILAPRGDPTDALRTAWRPAEGSWLVAEAQLHAPGCADWSPSTAQFELRLDHVTRRHLKIIPADCAFPGMHAVVGDVHTDAYDGRRCGGDHMVDMNGARDALVARLSARPNTSVRYVQVRGPWPVVGGCGTWALDDGRVAVVTLG